MSLQLPLPLAEALWAHAARAAPRECVGALGGFQRGHLFEARTLYPLANIAEQPNTHYLADPGELVRALKAMQAEGYGLVGLYHSHPRGPAFPSRTDAQLAAYPVPHLIADVSNRVLRAYLLPEGRTIEIMFTGPDGVSRQGMQAGEE